MQGKLDELSVKVVRLEAKVDELKLKVAQAKDVGIIKFKKLNTYNLSLNTTTAQFLAKDEVTLVKAPPN